MYILIPLALATFGGVIYLAIASKSNFKVRLASLGALAVMVLAVIICLFVIFAGGSSSKVQEYDYALPEPPAQTGSGSSAIALIFFIIFILAVFLLIAIVSLREHRKKAEKKPAGNDW